MFLRMATNETLAGHSRLGGCGGLGAVVVRERGTAIGPWRGAGWGFLVLALLGAVARAAAPVAEDASYAVEPGAAVTIALAATDADHDPLSYIIVSPLPTLGTVSAGGTTLASTDLPYTIPSETIIFTAGADSHGQAAIKFKANDGSSNSAEATITVSINRPPIAEATTTFFTKPATDLKITLPAVDPDADTLTYTIESLPGHGRIKIGSTALADADISYNCEAEMITYSPDTNFHGQDQFAFTATDGEAVSEQITVKIEVNTTPVPAAITVTILPNGSATIALSATDADKDPVQFVVASLPDHGTLGTGGQTVTEADLPLEMGSGIQTLDFKLQTGYRGRDTFHYRAKDAVSISDRAVVTIIVNTPPVAPGSQFSVPTGAVVAGKLSPTDADGDALSVRISRLGASGTLKLDGKTVSKTTMSYVVPAGGLPFTYTFSAGFTGTDSFAWVASDGVQDSAAAEVTLSVQAQASQPASEPTTQPEGDGNDGSGDGGSEGPDGDTAPSCAPLGGGWVMMSAFIAAIIGPRSWRRRRSLAGRRVSIVYKIIGPPAGSPGRR